LSVNFSNIFTPLTLLCAYKEDNPVYPCLFRLFANGGTQNSD